VHDARVMDRLIRDDDTAVYGDKGYASGPRKRAAEAGGVLWAVKEKATPGHGLTVRQRARNRRFGNARAKVEHVFRVIKAVRLSQGALSRSRQERRACVLAAGARQSVSRPQDDRVHLNMIRANGLAHQPRTDNSSKGIVLKKTMAARPR
jgi:transposase, IS5 family